MKGERERYGPRESRSTYSCTCHEMFLLLIDQAVREVFCRLSRTCDYSATFVNVSDEGNDEPELTNRKENFRYRTRKWLAFIRDYFTRSLLYSYDIKARRGCSCHARRVFLNARKVLFSWKAAHNSGTLVRERNATFQ